VRPIYLGVDVAGAKNTWVAGLSSGSSGLEVDYSPRLASLKSIVGYCEDNDVVAVAVDAQLAISISDENGFRSSDRELRKLLLEHGGSRNWVAAFNALMAVPVRGRLLADHLSPTVGTLIETHPRASLLFGLGRSHKGIRTAIHEYKPKGSDTREQKEDRKQYTEQLWRLWSERFGIRYQEAVREDGALDALVCATVAHRFHHEPSVLHKLRHDVPEKSGRGPFYVMKSTSQ
jgi:predicted nuclease with RNAse H fold